MLVNFEAIIYENDTHRKEDVTVIYDKEWQEEASKILAKKYPKIEIHNDLYTALTRNTLTAEAYKNVIFVGSKESIVNNISKLRTIALEHKLTIVSDVLPGALNTTLLGFSKITVNSG